jgi:hypothetical protein
VQRDSDREGDEDAWRAIIDNYGDRVQLDEDDPALTAPPEAPVVTWPGDRLEQERVMEATGPFDVDDGERFVPPEPPPLPEIPHDRKVAWLGLFGSPAVLLVCLVVGISLPPLLAYLLVGSFIGGFVYLVATMPRGPVDPWDNGARL